MRLILALVVVLVLCAASSEAWLFKENEYVKLFQSFITRFKRAYSTSTFAKKLLQFKKNLDVITNVNKSKRKFTLGVNDFADLTAAEYRQRLGTRAPKSAAALIEAGAEAEAFAEMTQEELNAAFAEGMDWEKSGKTLPIRNQGTCGSCWSFAAAATIETARLIAGQPAVVVAPQAPVSCVAKTAACLGCKGGWSECAFGFATTTGYFKESDYPYANQEAACLASTLTPAGKISSAKVVASGSAAAMIQGLKANSLWVTLDVGPSSIMFYKSGIIDKSSNCTTDINHAVVMVGYGADEKGTQFFRIRNSWGTTWGENGHFRIDASGDTCGILRYGARYPVV